MMYAAVASQLAPAHLRVRPSLGNTVDAIIAGFRALDQEWVGRRITEAHLVGGPVYRWMADGKLGIVVGEIGIRPASDTEVADLEEGIELGHVQIYTKVRLMFTLSDVQIAHQATADPLDQNSAAYRAYLSRIVQALDI